MRSSLVRHPIDVARLIDEVRSDGMGALSVFLGTVRSLNDGRAVTGIEYSAYDAMALREMDAIIGEAGARFPGVEINVEHRVGLLTVGETSVAIVAAHASRAPAMNAMRYVIEELKRRVPIWKLEHYVDGTREWVDPTAGWAA